MCKCKVQFAGRNCDRWIRYWCSLRSSMSISNFFSKYVSLSINIKYELTLILGVTKDTTTIPFVSLAHVMWMVHKGMSVKLGEDSVRANHNIRALTVTSVRTDITDFLSANVIYSCLVWHRLRTHKFIVGEIFEGGQATRSFKSFNCTQSSF